MKLLIFSLLYLLVAITAELTVLSSESCFYLLATVFVFNACCIATDFKSLPSLTLIYIFGFLFLLFEPLIYINNGLGFPTWFELGTQSLYAGFDYVLMISLFMFSLNTSYLWLKFARKKNERNNDTVIKFCNQKTSWFALAVILLFLVIGFIPYISNGFDYFIFLLISGRSDGFSQFDVSAVGNTNFLTILSNFIIACGIYSGTLLIVRDDMALKRIFLYAVLVFSILIIASGGGRTRAGFIIVPLLYIYFNYRVTNIRNIGKFLFVLLASGLLILSMVSLRDKGVESGEVDFELTGFNLNRELYYILSQKDYFPLVCESSALCALLPLTDTVEKFVTNPVPRLLYSGKYLDPSFSFYNNLRLGNSGLYKGSNITPTAIGRYYMLYGTYGVVFVGLLFGFFASYVDRKLLLEKDVSKVIFLSTLMYYIAQSIRDLNPGWLYPSVFTFLLVYLINKVDYDSNYRS
ncbi:TPA: oligosaccharide repeat unit polymerase [Escherichia coli]|nr:oligosaccharide repeat unit polymerase [Escherichia coli]